MVRARSFHERPREDDDVENHRAVHVYRGRLPPVVFPVPSLVVGVPDVLAVPPPYEREGKGHDSVAAAHGSRDVGVRAHHDQKSVLCSPNNEPREESRSCESERHDLQP